MIATAELIENLDEVVRYEEAVEEYGSKQEAALHDFYPAEKKIIDAKFMFNPKDVIRAWVQPNGISLDFGEGQLWVIKNENGILEKLEKIFKDEED